MTDEEFQQIKNKETKLVGILFPIFLGILVIILLACVKATIGSIPGIVCFITLIYTPTFAVYMMSKKWDNLVRLSVMQCALKTQETYTYAITIIQSDLYSHDSVFLNLNQIANQAAVDLVHRFGGSDMDEQVNDKFHRMRRYTTFIPKHLGSQAAVPSREDNLVTVNKLIDESAEYFKNNTLYTKVKARLPFLF